jgi:hypothetical protein
MGRDIGGKEMSYAYYIDDFSAAREKAYQEGLDGIRDYDDVLHYRGNLIMKRKIKRVVFILSILVVISLIGISYVSVQKPEKMTVEETVQLLLKYIYDEDYFPLCTKYCSSQDGPLLTVYENIRYPTFEFDMPNNRNHTRVQIFCNGESENGEYLDLGVYIWTPSESFHSDGIELVYERAELYSYDSIFLRGDRWTGGSGEAEKD